ncbi:DUF2612 domain-containing protein [Lederbergia citrisecunda]|uniref:DUF2612 domain-containing protein n=1 Tax=Lederbergia citrisecunda TaxID=2833583 RepID=UPI003D2A5B3E
MFKPKDIVRRFVDYFDKRPESNISKLISIFSEELEEAKGTNDFVRAWRSIDNAEGSTLDRIGEDVKQLRGVATDEHYRIALKAKIARNLSDGTMDSIINILSLVLSVPRNTVKIIEKWNDVRGREYAAIRLVGIPTASLINAGLTISDFVVIIQSVVAAGVKVIDVELDHNTHRELSPFTHHYLGQFTHNKVRIEVLTDGNSNEEL